MDIVKEQVDDLNAKLKVKVEPADYKEKVDQTLKQYRKQANIPGFRKGKVPAGMVKKMYGKAVLVEEVNKVLQDEVYKYILGEKLSILGSPIPVDTEINWETEEEGFEFEYELGLRPDIEVKISGRNSLPYYKIKASDEMINRSVEDYAKRYGKMEEAEDVKETDLCFGSFVQLDAEGNELEGGIQHQASVAVDLITKEETKNDFLSAKKGDTLSFNVKDSFENMTDIASMLNIDKEQLEMITGDFKFTIEKITRLIPAELNQELFDKVYGEGAVDSEEAFRNRIAEEIETHFVQESDRKFFNDAVDYLIEKTKFDMPHEFLKKWLQTSGEKPITAEEIEKDYEQYEKTLRWQLIESQVMEDNDLEVTEEDMKEETKKIIGSNFAQYGQPAPEGKEMDDIVSRVLSNQEEARRVQEQLVNAKIMNHFKSTFKLKEKETSWDDFLKLASS